MIDTKMAIILSEGAPVDIISPAGITVSTTALLGRASKQFNNTVSLETHRRGQFLPSEVIDSGYVVKNTVTDDYCLVVARYPEVIQNQKASEICHMFVCNCTINISSLEETADDRGKVSVVPVSKVSGQRAYVQALTADLKQYDAGLHPDAEYRIFAPYNNVTLLDKLTVLIGSKSIPLKVVHLDYLTYEGIITIQVCSETRRP